MQGLRQLANVPHVYLVLVRLLGPLDVVIERVCLLNCVQNALVEKSGRTRGCKSKTSSHMQCTYCAVSREQYKVPGSMPPYMHSAAIWLVDCFHSTAKMVGVVSHGVAAMRDVPTYCEDFRAALRVRSTVPLSPGKCCMCVVLRSASPALNALHLIFPCNFM